MKLFLLENQIELILKSLECYKCPEKQQLLYATYESILDQYTRKKQIKEDEKCNTNVTQM